MTSTGRRGTRALARLDQQLELLTLHRFEKHAKVGALPHLQHLIDVGQRPPLILIHLRFGVVQLLGLGRDRGFLHPGRRSRADELPQLVEQPQALAAMRGLELLEAHHALKKGGELLVVQLKGRLRARHHERVEQGIDVFVAQPVGRQLRRRRTATA
jgi:hypothetical protein